MLHEIRDAVSSGRFDDPPIRAIRKDLHVSRLLEIGDDVRRASTRDHVVVDVHAEEGRGESGVIRGDDSLSLRRIETQEAAAGGVGNRISLGTEGRRPDRAAIVGHDRVGPR